MPTSAVAVPPARPSSTRLPDCLPATIVWTDSDGVDHQAAANASSPSHELLDTMMRPPSGPNHVVEHPSDADGLVSALGGDQALADAILVADRDPVVVDFAVRPAEIRWHSVPSAPTFVVPMLQRLRNRRYRVVETRAERGSMTPMIRAVCDEIGWEYTIFERPSEMTMITLRDLAIDRHWWVVDGWSGMFDRIVRMCRYPQPIGTVCRTVSPSDPEQARALVNFAIWHEFLIADLESAITEETEVIASVDRR